MAPAVALLLTFATACGDGPRTPTAPTSPTTTTTPTNSVPVTSGSIPAQSLPPNESIRLDVAQYFSDPDGDALTYEATSSDTQIATVTVTESTAILTGENVGRADIQVTARDPQGGTATQLFPGHRRGAGIHAVWHGERWSEKWTTAGRCGRAP